MSLQEQLGSWMSPTPQDVDPVPVVGTKAPSSSEIPIPNPSGKPTIVTFLRHCACPFAEKTFREFRHLANRHHEATFIAVSHSDQESTDDWIIHIGGEWDVLVVVDPERKLYAQWGLGTSTTWHIANPMVLYSAYKLGEQEGIWKRSIESGNKWQIAGSFAMDQEGIVKWAKVAESADDIPDFKDALSAVVQTA